MMQIIMCFSSTASFTAAAVLGLVGCAALRKVSLPGQRALAAFPIFFALQQASEGVLWVAIDNNMHPTFWSMIAQYSYLFFAYLFWPVWTPFAMGRAEPLSQNRSFISFFLWLGIAIFLVNGYYLLTNPLLAQHIGQSLQYDETNPLTRLIYAVAVITPFFLSSVPRMGFLGVITLVSFAVADYAYYQAFTSMWCFYAAIMSFGFYFVLTKR